MARPPHDVVTPITLPDGPGSLRHRLADALVREIRAGTLADGDRLPSTRALARTLGVARTAVVEAFDELAAAGWVVAVPGSATRVAAGARSAARTVADPVIDPPRRLPPAAPGSATIDLTPGAPDPDLVSRTEWRRAWRRAADAAIGVDLDTARSHPELRAALSAHLRRTRGIVARADEIVVVPGVAAALRALCVAADLNGRDVAFEDPGYPRARHAFVAAGATPRAVSVDGDGLDPALLRPTDRAVYCTPAHQYPTGGRMPVTRRAALVDAARTLGALVVEDDYDGEFRYGTAPLPALRSVRGGRDCVAYVGTASKILTPTLRLAWIVAPRDLHAGIADALDAAGEHCSGTAALALAAFVESGALTRHLARASRTYAARRAAFVTALTAADPGGLLAVDGIGAGLHVVVRPRSPVPSRDFAAELARAGVLAPPLAEYSADDSGSGVVCGYSRLREPDAPAAARALVGAARACVRTRGGRAASGPAASPSRP
ncbi:PLP-dependent aminotransferase family protein [Rhodococcus sp. HNM0569]|uniref:MocR-like pyridoxine biosynthesis transcription factor PdxR n=1 Tax=Rhodococcus sp. HNM0569 TaxID=2716340 RepID=UPI00146DCE0D|nr:PLP-dependent aminotransferase family protein [Rhodococcus sp. HNM0569]NLU85025.1 PLP-dependent aminotransferase family protein [Rhodococcus sp. HNM0569]